MKGNRRLKIAILVVLDIILVNLSYILALYSRFDFSTQSGQYQQYLAVVIDNMLVLTVIKIVVFACFKLYRSLWRYAGADELIRIFVACVVANGICLVWFAFRMDALPRSVYILDGMFDVFLVGGMRMAYRLLRNYIYPGEFSLVPSVDIPKIFGSERKNVSRALLVGAGDAGALILRDVNNGVDRDIRIVAVADDDKSKIGQRIMGVKIAGGRNDIPEIVEKYRIDQIIVAIPSATKKDIKGILDICRDTVCKIKIMPSIMDIVDEKVSVKQLRDVDIDDLLGRDPVKLDQEGIADLLTGRIVLVTGGGGSIGSEICRQVARFNPKRLIIFDIYENSTYELANELKRTFPSLRFNVEIGSVRDRGCLEALFKKYKPHVVFHAAAHKHVPLMEDCPKEAIINNVLGTKNTMDMAEKYRADRFVLISTDKAVNPTNVMGCSKRMCEMVMQYKALHSTSTSFVAVRFGNVLGSNGSVIPLFRKQIQAGGPVTVTDPEITRFFMTIPEAVQLVIQAGAMANGGEIFILDMGEPVKIVTLAENLIRLSGFKPYEDIDITFTGLRPGEKLYEELLMSEEGIKDTGHSKIFIGHPIELPEKMQAMLEKDGGEGGLSEWVGGIRQYTDDELKQQLTEIVPTYTITPND